MRDADPPRGVPAQRLSVAQVRDLAERYRDGGADCTVLRALNGKVVCRMPGAGRTTVVLKLWSRPGWRGWLRRATRTGPLDREVRILHHLGGTDVHVPRVLGAGRLGPSATPWTVAAVLEDLGPGGTAMDHVKALLRDGRADEADRFEQGIVEMTGAMLRAGVVDSDHSMINVIVTGSGSPARLDFEVARCVVSPRLVPAMWGAMIGRLVATHAFTVQPDADRAQRFAARLADHVRPPKAILGRARALVEQMMETQRLETGIDTRLDLAW